VPRLLAGLRCPKKGLVGPWAHTFPHDGVPGPAIGFLQEALRWWRQWLAGEETGIMRGPLYRVWLQESVEPLPTRDEWPGRWVGEDDWPSPKIERRVWTLNANGLDERADAEESEAAIASPQTTGLFGGEWCAFGAEGEMPGDQRPDDGRSLCFDSEPLAERLEILGAPVVTLELVADRPVAFAAVRLCEVAPDGTSLRVTYGLLNLTHREDHEHPEPLEPGRRYAVRVQLNDAAHAFPAGSRLRVAVSTAYWPIAWPAPEPVTLRIFTGVSTLDLPVRSPRAEDAGLRRFEPPERGPTREPRRLRAAPFRRTIERDLAANDTVYTLISDAADLGGAALARVEAIDLDVGHTITRRYRIGESDPLSARAEIDQRTDLRRGDWCVRVETRTCLEATRTHFHFEADLEAFENDERIFHKHWDERIPRDLV
jgi:predicted acyl esterase